MGEKSRQYPDQVRALLILGMHRSSTSALTRVCSLLGADLPSDLIPAAPDNPMGFWEAKELVNLDDEILNDAGLNWHSFAPIKEEYFNSVLINRFTNDLIDYIHKEFPNSSLFVLKDPRISRLLPIWLEALKKIDVIPQIVISLRNPLEVAFSLKKRNNFSLTKSLFLWARYNFEAEYYSRGQNRIYYNYDELLNDWRNVTNRIKNCFYLSWPNNNEHTEYEIDLFLNAEQRHNIVDNNEFSDCHDITYWIKEAYYYFQKLIVDSHDSETLQYLDDLNSDIKNADLIMGDKLRDYEHEIDMLSDQMARNNEQLQLVGKALSENQAKLDLLEKNLLAKQADFDETQQTLHQGLLLARQSIDRFYLNIEEYRRQLEEYQQAYDSIRQSVSWKLTSPLRALGSVIKKS